MIFLTCAMLFHAARERFQIKVFSGAVRAGGLRERRARLSRNLFENFLVGIFVQNITAAIAA